MYDNIFLYNDDSEIDITNLDIDNSVILMNFIPDTNLFESLNYNIKSNVSLTQNNFLGTNISFYFGYNDIIKPYLSKNNIINLISNVIIKNNYSSIIDKYYTQYISSYKKHDFDILHNLYENIKLLHNKIEIDYQFSQKKKYELEIVNKAVIEYFEDNINEIIDNYFLKIHLFYILSIILSPKKNNYILIYNNTIINHIKKLLNILD